MKFFQTVAAILIVAAALLALARGLGFSTAGGSGQKRPPVQMKVEWNGAWSR